MVEYEYKLIPILASIKEDLNNCGKQGWRAVMTVSVPSDRPGWPSHNQVLLEREKGEGKSILGGSVPEGKKRTPMLKEIPEISPDITPLRMK